jgi:hypothetical protein
MVEDMATWITRAVYYHSVGHDPALDRVIAERMDEARGCSGEVEGPPCGA